MTSLELFDQLIEQLSRVIDTSNDGSHDLAHLRRVWRAAQLIAAEEGGDLRLLAAAVILHDCVEVRKGGASSKLGRERPRSGNNVLSRNDRKWLNRCFTWDQAPCPLKATN